MAKEFVQYRQEKNSFEHFFFNSDVDPDEIEKYFKERYGPRGRAGYDDEDYGDYQIPDVKSPYLWPVKCRMGEEKQTALLLMRKYLALESNEKVNDPSFLIDKKEFTLHFKGLTNQISCCQRR